MEEDEIHAPLFYVMGREAAQDAAHFAFTITPCLTGVVCKHTDKALIEPFVDEVLQASDEQACRELAAHIARANNLPVLTVGAGKEITAVFPEGDEEILCLSKLTSMN